MVRSFAAAALAAAALSSACSSDRSPVEPTAPSAAAPSPGPSTPPRLTPAEVIATVASRYPERLVPGVSLEQRVANMEFLRDRIIEVGICGGLNLAWNRKTNGARSIDAIDWRHEVQDINDVVDLALSYDDTDRPLQLHWAIVGGPAGWDPYPAPACSGG
ncbi:MAG TPA: hypothetical protein VJ813_15645 [Vicinamibacterales bacterium]|nr:hypothetical protein [Vicinamibacterales bacterium]